MKFYIKQKFFSIGDKYSIMDASGNPCFYVEGEIFSFGAKIHFYNNSGQELFYIQQKVLSFLHEYHIYSGNQFYASVKKKLTFFTHDLDVQCSYGNYTIDGDFFGWTFNIYNNGIPVGRIQKVMDWSDSYELDIADNENIPFVCALVVAIDNCVHDDNN